MMRQTPRLKAAVAIATVHFALCLLMQAEAALNAGVGPGAAARLLLLQDQAVFASVLLGLLAAALWPTRLGRVVGLAIATIANAVLVADHVAYAVFQTHLDVVLRWDYVRALPLVWDSIAAELGAGAAVNLLALVVASALLWSPRGRERLAAALMKFWPVRPKVVAAVVAAYCVLSATAAALLPGTQLEAQPLFSLSRRLLSSPAVASIQPGSAALDLYRLRFDTPRQDTEEMWELPAAFRRIHARHPQPNILFIVLESVGAMQLMPDGQIDTARTPILARLATQAVLFDTVYVSSPDTYNSLLLLQTGGQVITWGANSGLLSSTYSGPLLAHELAQAGYRTAFVTPGDLSFADTLDFVQMSGYDHIFHAGSLTAAVRAARKLNSWGVDDEMMYDDAATWATSPSSPRSPFFLQLQTLATHHPYTVPVQARPTEESSDAATRYEAALAYTDAAIGRLLNRLAQQGDADNTIVVVAGDHGEGFGKRHRNNYTHGSALYEESIRTFLMIAAPGTLQHPVVSHRIATLGDVMPTLLALVGSAPGVPGHNLFAASYTPHLVFFQTRGSTARLGLRDGRWKFISGFGADHEAHVFDLATDPLEQDDRAASMPELTDTYGRLCTAWYEQGTSSYAAQTANGEAGLAAVEPRDLSVPGPTAITLHAVDRHGPPQQEFQTDNAIVATTEWVPYADEKLIRYRWHGPNGEARSVRVPLRPGERFTNDVLDHRPLAPGDWDLRLSDGATQLAEIHFAVH